MIDGPPTHVKFIWDSDCSVALRFVFLTQQQQLNCADVIISTSLRLPLHGRLSTVPNFTSSLLMLFFVQPLFRNFVINCLALNVYFDTDFWSEFCLLYWTASKLLHLLDTASKFELFLVSGLKDEKLIKQESPAIADKPARRESMPKIAQIRRAYNVVADNTGLYS